jgi:lysophospholipase L1-like esterase
MRLRRRGLLVAVLAVAGVAAPLVGVPGPAAAQDDAFVYVALGDSYASGEGTFDYGSARDAYGGDDDCHRSDRAWPALLRDRLEAALPGPVRFIFAACSGADTANVLTSAQGSEGVPQIERIPPDADLVTVQITGNDAHYGPVLENCTIDLWGDCLALEDDLDTDVAGNYGRLLAVLDAVAARAPGAVVVLVDYPVIFPEPGGDLSCTKYAFGQNIDRPEHLMFLRHWFRQTDVTRQAARALTTARFVQLRDLFAGHDVCSGRDRRWANPLVTRWFVPRDESYHPNVTGHAVTAEHIWSEIWDPAAGALRPPDGTGYRHTCAGRTVTHLGTSLRYLDGGDEQINGTDGPDVIKSRGGDDVVDGRGGDDVVCAGYGDDVVRGGAGDDDLRGGPGLDTIDGGTDTDRCRDLADRLTGCEM